MRATNNLLAELLARYHNVNFRDPKSSDPPAQATDFLADRHALDAQDEDDESDAVAQSASEAASAIAAALNPLGAVATGHQLVMGSGARVDPSGPLGAFFRGGDEG